MGWSRRQIVTQAYSELGYSSYEFDLSPSQLQEARRQLDAMIAMWSGRGINLNYPLPDNPDSSDLDDDIGVPDYANEGIYLNLAIRLAPKIGKQTPRELNVSARDSYAVIIQKSAMPCEMQFPTTLPAGAGNKPWRNYNSSFVRRANGNDVTSPKNEVNFKS